jgi:hypothetical protein
MNKIARRVLIVILFVFLLAGCSSPASAPIPIDTITNTTATGSSPAAVRTMQPSQGLATPGANTADLIDYTHKQLIFHLKIPGNWKLDEQTSFTNLTAPDNSGSIQIAAVNTGVELNELGFANFVDATEANTFSRFLNYTQVERSVDNSKRLAYIRTTLDINKVPQKIISIYKRQGKIVFYMLLRSDAIAFDKNNSLFEQIIPTSEFDSTYAADFIPYDIVYDFSEPNNLFILNVPSNWMYQIFKGENTIQDTFVSPDNHAKIQTITYNDGNTIPHGQTDLIALDLLKEIYAQDVRISETRTQPDLSIRWTWASKTGNIEGITFYEIRGTSFLMLTLLSETEYKKLFDPLFNLIIESYQLPK